MDKLIALTVGGREVNGPDQLPDEGSAGTAISGAMTIFLILGVVVALIFIILSGIQWIASDGDKQKIAAARSRLVYAIVGLVLMLLSFFIINIFGSLFGVELLNLTG